MTFDLQPLIEKLTIRDKQMQVVPLRLNWAQQKCMDTVNTQVNANRPIRIITLKARQLGVSTFNEALMFTLAFAWPGLQGGVVAQKTKASQNVLNMTKLFWREYPYRRLFTSKYVSRNEIAWNETDSSIWISTAGSPDSSRSATLNAVHASEVAFWLNADQVMLALRQTVPNTPRSMITLESTANGIGNMFYREWQAAEAGDSDYVPLFFDWQSHYEYTASYANLRVRPLGKLDEEERILRKIGVDDDHLLWRRWAIRNLAGNDIIKFHQEYPTTPEEAFISTGTNVFPVKHLIGCYKPKLGEKGRILRHPGTGRIEWRPAEDGELTIYKKPAPSKEWGQYFVGGDPTHSTRGDYAVAQVINRRTYEQVAVWRGRCDPATFATYLRDLARHYNDATIATEVEGPGYMTVGALLESGYPHIWRKRSADRLPGVTSESFGWSTSEKTKQWAVGWLLKLVVDRDVTLHDKRTFVEMRDFVTLDNGGYGPSDGTDYDDTVMALAIACICNASEPPLTPFADEPGYINPSPSWEEWGEEAG